MAVRRESFRSVLFQILLVSFLFKLKIYLTLDDLSMSNYFSTNPAELRKPFQDEIPQICSVTPRLKGRHLGFTCPRGRGYFASRLSHTSKSISNFQLKRLILSGDVCPNPGPAKYPVCIKTVARNHRALNCNLCQQWIHIKCGDVKPKDFKQIQSTRSNWSCSVCLFLELPFSDCYISNDIMSNANLVPTDAEMLLSFTQDLYPSLRTDLRHFPGFKVAHLNVNGLLSKILDIRALLSSIKFDILAITESHLNNNISNNVINIAGYKIARNDRKDGRKGGGSVIYFADHLDAYERYDINSHVCLEATWIDITIKSQKLLIGSIYRPPDSSSFLSTFASTMDRIWLRRSNIILLGDFNFNLLASHRDTNSKLPSWGFRQLLNKFNLKNVIDQPTRITDNSESLIDLIISSDTSKIYHHGACNLGISDHHLIYAVINLKRKQQRPNLKSIYDYKNVDVNALRQDFAAAPWSICNIFDDLDDATWAWEYLYKDIVKSHLRSRVVKMRSNSLPWMNSSIRKELNKRYKLNTF